MTRILAIAIGLVLPAVAQAREEYRQTLCHISAVSERILENKIHERNPFDRQIMDQFVIGQYRETLIGELDPQILGDGGLLILSTPEGNVAVYSPIEGAELLTKVAYNKTKLAMPFVAFEKFCLKELAQNSDTTLAIGDLTESVLKLERPVNQFILKD